MTRLLQRYTDGERMNHWFVALSFVLAALSGLAFFHPSFYFLVNLFGGGPWTRILHPFLGVLMVLAFLFMFFRMWRDNLLNAADRRWLARSGALIRGDKSAMPPVDKYNAGQKIAFWVMAVSLVALVVTGVLFWRPWFAASVSIPTMRIAVLIHAIAAVLLVLTVIIHVYAAIWIKGSVRAMTRGTVSTGWAKANHALWYERVARDKK